MILSCLETFSDADPIIIVAGDSNPPSCSSPVGNPGAVPFARGAAQTAQASSWLEQNNAGASSPEPGAMNTPPSRPESSESNVQVWKLDAAAAAENSESSNETQQPLQSFTLQETLFVEQLAAIDERVRSQVWPRSCDQLNLTLTAFFFRFQWTRHMSGHS